MPEAGPIVVVGAHCPGLFVRVSSVPGPGETVLGWGLDEPLDGGKATNQAVAAARLGAPVTFVSLVGDDERGNAAVAWLRNEGVDVSHLMQERGATDVGFIILAEDGVPAIVSTCDRSHGLTPARVETAAAACRSASVVVCQLEAPATAALAAFRLARDTPAITVLNPAPAAPLDRELLDLTDVLMPNASEAAALLGHDGALDQLAGELAEQLAVSTVVVTAGGDGAYLASGGTVRHFAAPRVEAVDTTGAGDAFVGAFAVALRAGATAAEAVPRAIAVASRSVGFEGSIPSYRWTAEDVAAAPA
jgi:ribokinase